MNAETRPGSKWNVGEDVWDIYKSTVEVKADGVDEMRTVTQNELCLVSAFCIKFIDFIDMHLLT